MTTIHDWNVEDIEISGLERSKRSLLDKVLCPILEAKDVPIQKKLAMMHLAMHNLGIFESVGLGLTKNSPFPKNLHVQVKEKKRILGNVGMKAGNQEVTVPANLQIRNASGNGEIFDFTASLGNWKKCLSGSMLFRAPVNFTKNGPCFVDWSGSAIARDLTEVSGAFSKNASSVLKYGVPFNNSFLQVGIETCRRKLYNFKSDAPAGIKSFVKPSSKVSLFYNFSVDKRDDQVLPTSGSFIKLAQELGFGLQDENYQFLKSTLDCVKSLTLFNCPISMTMNFGYLFPFKLFSQIGKSNANDISSHYCDRFFTGGPQSVRGFPFGKVGPVENEYALGGNLTASFGLSLFSPLLLELPIRAHLFANAGATTENNTFLGRRVFRETLSVWRNHAFVSTGVGLVWKLGDTVRVEVNYVIPRMVNGKPPTMTTQKSRLHFGIGMEFL